MLNEEPNGMKYVHSLLAGWLIAASAAVCFAQPAADLAWEKYISSQKKMQVAFHHLVRLHWPELAKTIKKSQELQLAYADQRSDQFYFLAENVPEKIVRDRGFSAFVHFEWLEKDEEKLSQSSAAYRKRQKQIERLRKELDTDPQYPEIQNRLHSLENDRKFLEIRARFRFVAEEVEELLRRQRGGV